MKVAAPRLPRLTLRHLAPVVVCLVALSVSLLAVRFAPYLKDLAGYGYVGVYFLMVFSGGSILFPTPGFAGVMAAGGVWNPWIVGMVAGLGNATGEFTGYLAGRSGRTLLGSRESPTWVRLEGWLHRRGIFALIVLASIPNPVFDAVGIIAGSLGFSARKFFFAVAIGNIIKYTAIAFLGDFATSLFPFILSE